VAQAREGSSGSGKTKKSACPALVATQSRDGGSSHKRRVTGKETEIEEIEREETG
jgi:hypothetical protein